MAARGVFHRDSPVGPCHSGRLTCPLRTLWDRSGARPIPYMENAARRVASEPHPAWILEADDRARTGDPQLGKLMLYQLSYVRVRVILLRDSRISGRSRQ